MKTEIKDLCKKDPKLAKEVAKVLGYTIKIKAAEGEEITFKDLPKQTQNTLKLIGWLPNVVDKITKSSLYRIQVISKKKWFLRKEILKYLMKDPNFDVATAMGPRVLGLSFLYPEGY